ncbi:barstar family protein [Streptomyces sp. NPDC014861]|uniref:barstar family protein n=1 Tax=Streptomyces sp. NPDC014861 TaxID=3364923 RepID=UPI0036FA3BFD
MALDDAVVLDLRGVTDKTAFMDRCVRALPLPVRFGRNWDALADSLADLREPMAIVVTGWHAYAEAEPDDWAVAQEVFSAAAATSRRGLAVLLSLGGWEDRTSATSQGSDDPTAVSRAPDVGE